MQNICQPLLTVIFKKTEADIQNDFNKLINNHSKIWEKRYIEPNIINVIRDHWEGEFVNYKININLKDIYNLSSPYRLEPNTLLERSSHGHYLDSLFSPRDGVYYQFLWMNYPPIDKHRPSVTIGRDNPDSYPTMPGLIIYYGIDITNNNSITYLWDILLKEDLYFKVKPLFDEYLSLVNNIYYILLTNLTPCNNPNFSPVRRKVS